MKDIFKVIKENTTFQFIKDLKNLDKSEWEKIDASIKNTILNEVYENLLKSSQWLQDTLNDPSYISLTPKTLLEIDKAVLKEINEDIKRIASLDFTYTAQINSKPRYSEKTK